MYPVLYPLSRLPENFGLHGCDPRLRRPCSRASKDVLRTVKLAHDDTGGVQGMTPESSGPCRRSETLTFLVPADLCRSKSLRLKGQDIYPSKPLRVVCFSSRKTGFAEQVELKKTPRKFDAASQISKIVAISEGWVKTVVGIAVS